MRGLAYASGVSPEPLIGRTIGAYFDEVCAAHPERPALVARHQGVGWTYAELKARVDALVSGLIALGLSPGDRVGVWAPNCWGGRRRIFPLNAGNVANPLPSSQGDE